MITYIRSLCVFFATIFSFKVKIFIFMRTRPEKKESIKLITKLQLLFFILCHDYLWSGYIICTERNLNRRVSSILKTKAEEMHDVTNDEKNFINKKKTKNVNLNTLPPILFILWLFSCKLYLICSLKNHLTIQIQISFLCRLQFSFK
jgi:hypothetical protein